MTTPDGGVPDRMRVAVLDEPHRIGIEYRPTPIPAEGEVLVRVTAVGVCGSDVHYYEHGRIGDFVVTAPLVLGHEAGGRIVAVGPGVPRARVGERVAVEPGRSCGECSECTAGRYNLCPRMRFFGTPPVDGALCEYVCVLSRLAFAVPESISDDAAGLLEPLSVGIWAARKAAVTGGSSVFIAGAGPIGLVTTQVARAFGATEVVVSDVSEERLRVAQSFGATSVSGPGEGDGAFDAFIDCSGAPSAIEAGVRRVRPAGSAVLVGMGPDDLPLPLGVIQQREVRLTGTFRYANTWPTAIALTASGRVDLDAMVTAHFALAATEDALLATRKPGQIKVIVQPHVT
ncbi:MAG: gutB 1 [Pseudonocardiales bacterium]|nr:gutB 1 [Pseudonocardiales bacterium]